MKSIYFKTAILLLSFPILFGCSKEEEEIDSPKVTVMEFGMVNRGFRFFEETTTDVYTIYENSELRIQGWESYNAPNDPWGISISIPNNVGTYYITEDGVSAGVLQGEFSTLGERPYFRAIEGKVILVRTDDKLVKGTFHFVAINDSNGQVQTIHSGKFEAVPRNL